jgi:hypothetical protein
MTSVWVLPPIEDGLLSDVRDAERLTTEDLLRRVEHYEFPGRIQR